MGALIEQGLAARAIPGEPVSGDRALVTLWEHGVLAAVVDGLGHGKAASDTAGVAIALLESHADEPLPALVQRCHQALRKTRGAVMSLASFDVHEEMMTWLGVGNVDGLLLQTSVSQPSRQTLLLRGGVVGYQLPPLHAYRLAVTAGDLLIFTTDGISSGFATGLSPDDPVLRHQPVQEIANRLLARFGKPTDDALVLVIRYLGLAS
jgi:phosphoserine phosphatase RsbX